uniref:MULE transposase domain-containing protein n=1 Tax=Romanomermis culicivorax TaxID=13658 RepID=A0A915JF38_ROMCU
MQEKSTIMSKSTEKGVPVCHALLTNKRPETYERLFVQIRNKLIHINGNVGPLHTVLMDFELGGQEAARNIFRVRVKGCIFHFSQSLIRWLNTNGLKMAYENNNKVKRWISSVRCLALLPSDLIPLA